MLELLAGEVGRAYRYLVSVPSASPEEAAAALKVDVAAAEGMLSTLVGRDLAAVREPDRYVACSPGAALQAELAGQEADLAAREAELRRARVVVDELLRSYRETARVRDTGSFVELLEGRSAIQQRVLSMQRAATREYLALVRARPVAVEPGDSPELMAERVRAVFEMDMLQNKHFRELVRDRTKPNYENRVYPGVPLRLAIADGEEAVVAARPDDNNALALLVRSESLILALRTYFETIWSAAAPMLLSREGDPEEWTEVQPERLSERERELVSMLLSGLTNEAIASHWGISRRSVVRQVQELMTRTGSTSRVHLGWEAHRRGWLRS